MNASHGFIWKNIVLLTFFYLTLAASKSPVVWKQSQLLFPLQVNWYLYHTSEWLRNGRTFFFNVLCLLNGFTESNTIWNKVQNAMMVALKRQQLFLLLLFPFFASVVPGGFHCSFSNFLGLSVVLELNLAAPSSDKSHTSHVFLQLFFRRSSNNKSSLFLTLEEASDSFFPFRYDFLCDLADNEDHTDIIMTITESEQTFLMF